MYKLSTKSQVEILRTLVEVCSIRSTERLTGHHRDTVMRLLVEAGKKAESVLNSKIKNIKTNHVQVDEAWTFVGKKNKNFGIDDIGDKSMGSQYVFVAIDRDTKLILTFRLGKRELRTCIPFINDLKHRIEGHTHITTDSYPPYTSGFIRGFIGIY